MFTVADIREIAVQIETDRDRQVRSGNLAETAQEFGFAVLMGFRDHGAMQTFVQQHVGVRRQILPLGERSGRRTVQKRHD